MYKCFFLLAVLTICNKSTAQTTTLVDTDPDEQVAGLAFDGNDLYYAEYGTKIYSIDITAPSPSPTLRVDGLSGPWDIILNGNDLYIADYFGSKISKKDISQVSTNTTFTDIVTTGLNGPWGLALNGNDLYVTDYSVGKLLKIDISAGIPTATEIITSGLGNPAGLALNGNDLYISDYIGGKILKADITANPVTLTTVVTGLTNPDGLLINGDFLYIAEYWTSKILKIDITSGSPVVTDVVTIGNNGGPSDIAFKGNDLYISDRSNKKILKVASVLPVELINFQGYAGKNSATLKWSTASELNNEKFEVEESANGREFQKIGEVEGNGTSLVQQDYSYEVENPRNGISYYRLKQMDYDGQFEYSKVITIEIATEQVESIRIYPNPVQSTLRLSTTATIEQVIIHNVLGQPVKTVILSEGQQELNVADLSEGMYYLQAVNDNGQQEMIPFVKK